MGKVVEGIALVGAAAAATLVGQYEVDFALWGGFNALIDGLLVAGASMEVGAIADALTQNRGANITTRQSAAYRQIIYGTRQVGGVLIYQSTTGGKHDQYNMVIALADHPCNAILGLYLDGRKVFWEFGSPANQTVNGVNFGGQANGNTYIGPDGSHYNFGGLVYCSAWYGTQTSADVDAGLTANDPTWAAGANGSPYLGGCTYVYLKIEYDQDMFPQQPEIRFTVQGKNDIFDPRTNTSGFTSNWALCVADILQNTQYGLGVSQVNINTAQLIAAANVSDERVQLASPQMGQTSELRYTCNWTGDTSTAPGDMLSNIMPAAMGRLSFVAGQWYIWPAYFQSVSSTWDSSSLVAPLQWSGQTIRDSVNRVKGTYVAPWFPYSVTGDLYDTNGYYDGTTANLFNLAWQPTDYPEYAQDTRHGYASDQLLADDGGVLRPIDLNQSACISVATAQRLAKIHLLRNRFSGSGTLSMTLDAYNMIPVDVMQFTMPQLGWNDKMLEVTGVRFAIAQGRDEGDAQSIYVEVDIHETDPTIYEWSITEELPINDVPSLVVNPPYIVDPPTNLTLSHSKVSFGIGASGDGILVSWTPSDDAYVIATSIQYQVSGSGTWISAGQVPQGNSQSGIAPLSGGTYNVEVSATRSNGAMSAFVSSTISF